eukprot:2661249-Amphidinium_carterae.1
MMMSQGALCTLTSEDAGYRLAQQTRHGVEVFTVKAQARMQMVDVQRMRAFAAGHRRQGLRTRPACPAVSASQRGVEKGPFAYSAADETALLQGLGNLESVRPEQAVGTMYTVVDAMGNELYEYFYSLAEAAASPWNMQWETYAVPLERISGEIDRIWSILALLRDVNDTGIAYHRAYHEIIPLITEMSLILSQSEEMKLALGLLDGRLKDDLKLTKVQQRIVEQHLLEMFHAGAFIETADTCRTFNQNLKELSALCSHFHSNIARANAKVVELDALGLPPYVVEQGSIQGGSMELELQPPTVAALLSYSPKQAVREKVYHHFAGRGWRAALPSETYSDGSVSAQGRNNDNTWVIPRILQLRHEWAIALGYDSFVDLAMRTRTMSLKE